MHPPLLLKIGGNNNHPANKEGFMIYVN